MENGRQKDELKRATVVILALHLECEFLKQQQGAEALRGRSEQELEELAVQDTIAQMSHIFGEPLGAQEEFVRGCLTEAWARIGLSYLKRKR